MRALLTTTAAFALAAFAAFSALAGCTKAADEQQARCDAVNAAIESCLGKGSALFDCSTVSDADLSAAETLTGSAACSFAADQPIDGDETAATCRMYGVGCASPILPAPPSGTTKYPLVLVNGIDTSPLFRYNQRIVDALLAQGNRVYLATLTPYSAPPKRAPVLQARIDEVLLETGAAKVNLVCHSLGGLDCRYYASSGGLAADLGVDGGTFAAKVASITTVGTVHQGTRSAEAALGLLPGDDASTSIDAFASFLGGWFSADSLASDPDVRAALTALTPSAMKSFNAEIVDADGVLYQSFAGVTRPGGASSPIQDAKVASECAPTDPKRDGDGLSLDEGTDWIALPLEPLYFVTGSGETDPDAVEPNDGVATVTSARWGKFRGCIPADHMEQLGQYQLPDVNVRTGIDIASFYAAVAGDLARQGQ